MYQDTKLRKLIRVAHEVKGEELQQGVDIIEKGYCYSCEGECRYLTGKEALETTDNIHVVACPDKHNGFADAPTSTLIKIAKIGEG